MREFTAALAIAAALIATDARAEAWTYTDETGQEQNTDACPYQDCRGTDREPPPKPKPGAPVIIEEPGDKKPRLQADKRDHEPKDTTVPGYYCILKGEVVNFRNAPGVPPKQVTRACPSYAHKVNKNGGVPGPFGPHEGGR